MNPSQTPSQSIIRSNSISNKKQVSVKELYYDNKAKLYVYPCEQAEEDVVQEILHFQIQVSNICNKYNWKIKKVSNNGRKYELEEGIEIHYINFTEDVNIRREYNRFMQTENKNEIMRISQPKNNTRKSNTNDNKFDYQIAIRFVGLNDILDDDDKNDEESDIDMLIDIDKNTNPKIFSVFNNSKQRNMNK